MEALGTPCCAELFTMATIVRLRHTRWDNMATLQKCRRRARP